MRKRTHFAPPDGAVAHIGRPRLVRGWFRDGRATSSTTGSRRRGRPLLQQRRPGRPTVSVVVSTKSDDFRIPETGRGSIPTVSCMLKAQDVEVDPHTRRTWRGGREILLSRKEFDLVHALIARAGHIVTRDELMRDVWQTSFWTSSKTIDVHLGWVRRKLGDDSRRPRLITTIRGKGLRFETEDPTH